MKKLNINLIPDRPNTTPDYYCTWQTQLYATSDGKPPAQRAAIGERALFGEEYPYGWAYFYPDARADLHLIMDDSWDVPLDGDEGYYGSLILNPEKFPSATAGGADNVTALSRLVSRIRALGWRGLGGWVCAQESAHAPDCESRENYWRTRMREAERSGFSYWKVDWGRWGADADFRRMLTALARSEAPSLTVEQAICPETVPAADVFRTYDVPAIMSVPMTVNKLAELLANARPADQDCAGLLNCEDEVYTAAAGGFVMGVMRHPLHGALPDGRADMSFPAVHRDLKSKMQEVVRAVRFHRIAPAFDAGACEVFIDTEALTDTWRLECPEEEIEAWWFKHPAFANITEKTLRITAPARIARGCVAPRVTPDADGRVPYVIASRNPNGVFAIATLGRTEGRRYAIPHCAVEFAVADADTVGVFGEYASLTLKTDRRPARILMQDLADSAAYDVTDSVTFAEGEICIPGELISHIGRVSQPASDTSEPGALVRLE